MANSTGSRELKKAIGAAQFLTLSFAAIVGVGWIVVLGDWLKQAGPVGAVIAFSLASVVMMLVGFCYAELVTMIPVSGGEIAYNYEVFGLKASFLTGWFLALLYIATAAFEAISAGWIVGVLFPALKGVPLYTVRNVSVMSGGLIFSLGGTLFLTILNYRSTTSSAKFQEILTYVKFGIAGLFFAAAVLWGKTENLKPYLARTETGQPSWNGVLSVFIAATFWLAGFNVVAQVLEEKKPRTSYPKVAAMLILSIGMASLFYCSLILCSAMAMPWQNLLGFEFPAVAALKVAFDSEIWAKVVLVSGLIGLLATWNSFFIAASRTIFALGRARIIHAGFAKIHPAFGSPSSAILFVGVTSSAGVILGRGAIMPIVNTASGCWVLLYFLVSFGIIWMRRTQPGRVRPYRIPGGLTIPVLAALASLLMLFESFYLPYINNKGRIPVEWILFFGWGLLGVLFWKFGNRLRAEVSERKRRELILGKPAQKAL